MCLLLMLVYIDLVISDFQPTFFNEYLWLLKCLFVFVNVFRDLVESNVTLAFSFQSLRLSGRWIEQNDTVAARAGLFIYVWINHSTHVILCYSHTRFYFCFIFFKYPKRLVNVIHTACCQGHAITFVILFNKIKT